MREVNRATLGEGGPPAAEGLDFSGAGFRLERMLTPILLAVMFQTKPPVPKPMWTGELTLTLKGNGTIEEPYPKIGKRRVTWKVDRTARGRVVLDHMFKGGGIAGTPSTRDTVRYETWIANAAQPLDLQVSDTGTYYGPTPSGAIALDLIRITCPTTTPNARPGQIRSSILQFDYEKGTYSWETPRLFTTCNQSHLRTLLENPNRKPFELVSGPVALEYEIVHQHDPLEAWAHVNGTFKKGDTEIVLSRTFEFRWQHPIVAKAPVKAELVLVLRKTP